MDALETGAYRGTAKDREDGFIHFSTSEQLVETLKLHYADDEYQRMLAISSVDTDVLGENLKWEPSRNGDLFPHLYATLTRNAVHNTIVVFYRTLTEEDFATVRDFVAGKGIFEHS